MASAGTKNPYLMSGYGGIKVGRDKPQMVGAPGSHGTALALQIRSQKGWGK